MNGFWLRVAAWAVLVASAGCDSLQSLSDFGVCEALYADGHVCTEATDGRSSAVKRHCNEDVSTFHNDVTCSELGYVELCQDIDGTQIYSETGDGCAAWNDTAGT